MKRWLWVLAVPLALVACKEDEQPADDTGVEEAEFALMVEPAVGGRGTEMEVRVTSNRGTFRFGETDIDLGEGITVESVTVNDSFEASARVLLDPDAELGPRDVTVTIEGEATVLPEAFEVISQSFFVDPSNGKMGETLYVALVGTETAWEDGWSFASFGEGVDVLQMTVFSEGLAEARISIRPDAAPGPRDVAMQEGGSVVTQYDGFTVDRAVITAFWEPPEAYQGQTVAFTITGLDTSFSLENTSVAFWDDGGANPDIAVIEQRVIDEENMYGRIRLSNAARLGYRDVLVTTGDESILIPEALEVLDAPPDLSNVIPGLGFDVYRTIDNATGEIAELVDAYAYFVIPLNPPCGNPPPPGDGPVPYDNNGVWPVPPPAQPADCPDPETVSAGDYVWFEGPENVVTLHKFVNGSNGQILYLGEDLTLADYKFDTLYDLHTQGDPDGIPEVLVEKVQPTVPADYYLESPQFWGDLTVPRTADFEYTWTPAQTYPNAIFGTQISGTLVVDDEGGFAGCLPWDDGVHTYTPTELTQLNPGPVTFMAYSHITGPYFGLPFSSVQTARSDSILQTQAQMILE